MQISISSSQNCLIIFGIVMQAPDMLCSFICNSLIPLRAHMCTATPHIWRKNYYLFHLWVISRAPVKLMVAFLLK